MAQTELVVILQDGIIQEVFASDPDCEIWLVDWETQTSEPSPHLIQTEWNGQLLQALVTHPNPRPLRRLSGSDAEAVIEAASQLTSEVLDCVR